MKKFLLTTVAACFLGQAAFANIIIYNQNNPPDDTNAAGNGNYGGFSLRLDDSAFTVDYTLPEAPPLPATVHMTDLTFRRGTGSGGTSNVYVSIYTTQIPSTATFVANSLNTDDLRASGTTANVTYTFDYVPLSTSQTYWFYFTTVAGAQDGGTGTWNAGRLRVSNDASNTYSSGNLMSTSGFNSRDTAYDVLFVINAVPEPAAAGLGLLGMMVLGFLRRKR